MTQPVDTDLIELLVSRDGTATSVSLKSGARLTVHNIAWGYDLNDQHAHITTNISPQVDGATVDFFYTDEVEAVLDAATGTPLA